MTLSRVTELMVRCPRCRRPVILTYGETSYRNLLTFEPEPWAPSDEPEPEGLTDAGRRRWREQLPWKLGIAYIDFKRGTWEPAQVRSNEKLRSKLMPLWKPHECEP